MGKKLDALFHRNIQGSKFVYLANLVISRMDYLGKQRQVQYQQTRSDILQLLDLGQRDRVFLRLENLIREQNMLDVYAMIENYLNVLMKRILILQTNKQCPDELKEAVSGLIFAASRCGELPELQKIRKIFTSRYGKQLETHAVQLSNNCGVSPKIVVKLSTQRPSFDNKLKVLKEVAPTHCILKQFEGESFRTSKEMEAEEQQNDAEAENRASSYTSGKLMLDDVGENLSAKLKLDENVGLKNEEEKYRNAKTAAQAALNFATHAAEAAKAAIELTRTHNNDPDNDSGSSKSKSKDEAEAETDADANATLKDKKKRSKINALSSTSSKIWFWQ